MKKEALARKMADDDTARFGDAEYMRCLREASWRWYRSLYWWSFGAAVLVATSGLAMLIAGLFNDVAPFYVYPQTATVAVWGYATWQLYRHKVKHETDINEN